MWIERRTPPNDPVTRTACPGRQIPLPGASRRGCARPRCAGGAAISDPERYTTSAPGPDCSAASEQFRGRLDRDLPPSVRDTVLLERDADRALERCEDIIITSRRPKLDVAPPAAGP